LPNIDSKKIIQTGVMCFVISVLIGFMVFARLNLMKYEKNLSDRFEIVIFLNKTVTAPEVVGEKIRAQKNVKDMIYFSKEAVKEKLKNLSQEILIAGDNPFPDTFSITIFQISILNVQELAKQLEAIPGVEEIKYDKSLLELIEKIKLTAKMTSVILQVVLTLFFIALLAGLLADYFTDKYNFSLNLQKSLMVFIGAFAGSVLGVLFIAFFKKIFVLDAAFTVIPMKWYIMILCTGVAAGYFQITSHTFKEKPRKNRL